MKTLLIFLAIVLIAAGWAVGLINIFSPGTVTVGLNLDVAATLFTGGCVLLGLAVVAGNLSAMTRRETDDVAAEDYAPATSTESDLPDFMAPASAVAAGARTDLIRKQTGHASDQTMARYIRDGDMFRQNAVSLLF